MMLFGLCSEHRRACWTCSGTGIDLVINSLRLYGSFYLRLGDYAVASKNCYRINRNQSLAHSIAKNICQCEQGVF